MKKLISLAAAAALLSVSSLAFAADDAVKADTTPSKTEESKTVKTNKEGMTKTETSKKEVVDGKTVLKTKEAKKTDAAGNVISDEKKGEVKGQ